MVAKYIEDIIKFIFKKKQTFYVGEAQANYHFKINDTINEDKLNDTIMNLLLNINMSNSLNLNWFACVSCKNKILIRRQ